MKTSEELEKSGFTDSGAKRYEQTLKAYSDALFDKAIVYAQADKASDTNLEVTHDHVRSAAHQLNSTYGREQPSRWEIPIQIGEYLMTALAGVAGGNLKENWGTPVFVLAVAAAVILFVTRTAALKR